MAGRETAPFRSRNFPFAPLKVITVAVAGKSPSATDSGKAALIFRVSVPAVEACMSSANSISCANWVEPMVNRMAAGSESRMVTVSDRTVNPSAVPLMKKVSSPSAAVSSVTSKSAEAGCASFTSVVLGSSTTAGPSRTWAATCPAGITTWPAVNGPVPSGSEKVKL